MAARFQRFLVTGGAGFIGSHLVDRLLERGGEVTVVDDFNDFYDPALKRENIRPHLRAPGYRLAEADIRDRTAMAALLESTRPEVVVHLAARAGVRPSVEDPWIYTSTNVDGTLNLLDAARRSGVARFVFGSSSSVYGLNEKVPFAETDPLAAPASPYAATKIAGEALCNTFSHLYGMAIVSLRFFTVFGPRQRPDLAIRKFAERMLSGQPIELFGDGSTSRDYTFVDDIVAGVLAAIDVDSTGHEIVNLGNSTPATLLELVRTLETVLGKKADVRWLPAQPGDVPRTYADLDKAVRLLGYRPATSLPTGITRMLDWMTARA